MNSPLCYIGMGNRRGKTYPNTKLPTPVLSLPLNTFNWMSVVHALFFHCKYQTLDIDYNLHRINLVIVLWNQNNLKELNSPLILILTTKSDR